MPLFFAQVRHTDVRASTELCAPSAISQKPGLGLMFLTDDIGVDTYLSHLI